MLQYNKKRGACMLNIAICEDNTAEMQQLKRHIKQFLSNSSYDLKEYSDGSSLLSDLPGYNFDIILMDIQLNEASGIDIAGEVNRLQPDTQIVYQSSNIEFFKSVYRTEHVYFLLKPVDYEDFIKAAEKALKNIEKKYIVVRNKEKVKCSDVVYIELINHDTVFHLVKGDFISARIKTNELLERLPYQFCRCHKGYIVNLDHAKNYKARKFFIMENSQTIPIGGKYAAEVNEKVIKYWRESVIC
jgi:DNA-binding LytR/AlgR family response regulator